jgi:hypothetical protein
MRRSPLPACRPDLVLAAGHLPCGGLAGPIAGALGIGRASGDFLAHVDGKTHAGACAYEAGSVDACGHRPASVISMTISVEDRYVTSPFVPQGLQPFATLLREAPMAYVTLSASIVR